MQFAMRDVLPDFLVRYPKVNVFAHATDLNVDIVGENFDVAIRAHSGALPDSTLVQRPLAENSSGFEETSVAFHGAHRIPNDVATSTFRH